MRNAMTVRGVAVGSEFQVNTFTDNSQIYGPASPHLRMAALSLHGLVITRMVHPGVSTRNAMTVAGAVGSEFKVDYIYKSQHSVPFQRRRIGRWRLCHHMDQWLKWPGWLIAMASTRNAMTACWCCGRFRIPGQHIYRKHSQSLFQRRRIGGWRLCRHMVEFFSGWLKLWYLRATL